MPPREEHHLLKTAIIKSQNAVRKQSEQLQTFQNATLKKRHLSVINSPVWLWDTYFGYVRSFFGHIIRIMATPFGNMVTLQFWLWLSCPHFGNDLFRIWWRFILLWLLNFRIWWSLDFNYGYRIFQKWWRLGMVIECINMVLQCDIMVTRLNISQ